MLKETLHLIIVLTAIIIALLLSVIFMQLTITSMIQTADNDIYNETMHVTQITYLKNGMSLITGKDGKNGFYKIYSITSELVDEGTFSYVGTDIYVHGISVVDNGFNLICNTIGNNGKYGLVYTYNLTEKELTRYELPYLPQNEDYTYFATGTKFYAAGQKYIYDIDYINKTYNTIKLSNVYKVFDIAYNDGNIYVVGQRALNSTLTQGTCAFYTAYNQSGDLIWEYNAMNEYKSVLSKVQVDKSGNLVMHGKITENNEYKFEKVFTPNIPNTKDDKLSSFLLYTDKEGNTQASNVYTNKERIYIDDITGVNENTRIMTLGYYIEDLTQSKYTCNINLINKQLKDMQSFKFTSHADTLYYVTGNDDIGLYACIHLNGTGKYRIEHYSTISDFISEMKMLNALKSVVKYMKEHIGSIIFLYISVITCFRLKTNTIGGSTNENTKKTYHHMRHNISNI